MRLGIVDLGTLSLRFDVYEFEPASTPRLLHRRRSMPRLGDQLFAGGRIDAASIERVVCGHASAPDVAP